MLANSKAFSDFAVPDIGKDKAFYGDVLGPRVTETVPPPPTGATYLSRPETEWRKSVRSGSHEGNCVEVARNLPGIVANGHRLRSVPHPDPDGRRHHEVE